MGAKTVKNRIRAKVWFLLPLPYGIHGFSVRDVSEIHGKTCKKASENRSAKKASIFGSWALPEGERSRKGCPKGPRGVPKGSPREAETAKHGSREGLEIRPVSEVCPEMLGWPPETTFGRISGPFWFNFRMIFDRFF